MHITVVKEAISYSAHYTNSTVCRFGGWVYIQYNIMYEDELIFSFPKLVLQQHM